MAYREGNHGYFVKCPASTGRKKAVSGGQIKIRGDDSLTSREACLDGRYEECAMCPNQNFDVTFKKIGDTADFEWLDEVINQVCLGIDAHCKMKSRTFGDCCFDHKDCIVLDYHFELKGFMDKGVGQTVYDMIMEASKGSSHEVVHVHIQRDNPANQSFNMRVALRHK